MLKLPLYCVNGRRQNPYFNRAWNHFSSHQHTPNNPDCPETPAAVLNGNIAYISWNVFEDYATKGELSTKELTLYAIDRLLNKDASVRTTLPDRGVITLTKKGDTRVVHLLFAYTTNRGKGIEVIEDAVPLYNTEVTVKTDKKPARVYLAPEGEDIPFEWDGAYVKFNVPKFVLHQMIAIE